MHGFPLLVYGIVGSRRMPASARPSVSHGIVEDQSELLSGFATAGDGQSESAVEYADEYWDSDTYEDDDDPGYLRQPIEDEEWFLAHEIDYPSDDERARPNVENPRGSRREKDQEKYEDEDCTFIEEEASSSLCSFSAHVSTFCTNNGELLKQVEIGSCSEVLTVRVLQNDIDQLTVVH